MARRTIKGIIDLSNRDIKGQLIGSIGEMSGIYEIHLKPCRNTRTLQQNRWYWSCLVAAFVEFMREQDYDIAAADECHEFLKARFLAVSVTNKATGEVLGRRVRSTTELTTEEFSDYCERARAWMADAFGVSVPDPDSTMATA